MQITQSNDPKAEIVREIVKHALGEPAVKTSLVPEQGKVNRAYMVETRNGRFVLRVRFDKDEMRKFRCEKQCADFIRRDHDWTPAVIAIGQYETHCYSFQERVDGTVASQYTGDMIGVWEQIGQYAKYFHGVSTTGYIFDVFDGELPFDRLWCQPYFDGLKDAEESRLVEKGLMTGEEFGAAVRALEPLKRLQFEPTLAHGNLTPKNIIVDPDGKVHIIDWGSCQGNLAADLDLSELIVFARPLKHIQAYLRGHELPADYLQQRAELLDLFQLVRFFTTANWLCEINSPKEADLASYIAGAKSVTRRLNSYKTY